METCRKCNSEVKKGRGRLRNSEGPLCPTCIKKMTKREYRRADLESKEYAFLVAQKEIREADEKAYRDAQAAIGRILFPLSGPRRELSIKTLDKILTALEVKDVDERALRINSIVKATSPKIEAAIREGKSKRAGMDDIRDDTGLSFVQGGQT